MKYFIYFIICLVSIFLKGEDSSAQSEIDAFENLLSSEVSEILFCELKRPFESNLLTQIGSLDEEHQMNVLRLLNEAEDSDGVFPFVGVVGYLVFLDKSEDVIAIVHCFERSNVVSVQSGYRRPKGIFLGAQNGEETVVYKQSPDLPVEFKKIRKRLEK